MVATTDRYATEVGRDVLAGGGNAVDAAVAVCFALAVVNPEAGNVGGGGFLLVRTPGGDLGALDFRSTAPRAARRDTFLRGDGPPGDRSVLGHLAAAVPGSVRGLWDAWTRFGSTPWAELVQPAVELADGFPVTGRLTRSLPDRIVEGLARFPSSADVFLPGGKPPREGDVLRQEHLARTLTRIRDLGPDGFYRGPFADLVVEEMERGGGLITREDLASYRSVWREPVRFGYRGRTVVSMPPSSSGGVTLALTAHLLAGFDPTAHRWHGSEHVHLLAEAWRRAYVDRNRYLADPTFADVPTEVLTSPEYGAWRAGDVRPDRATPSSRVGPGVETFLEGGAPADAGDPTGAPGREGAHTTHVSVVDGEGAAVALTTTLNTWYGSKLVVPGTGVLLNNEMDDLSTRPGSPNFFGLVQGEANAVEPGKRPLSAMTPTLVLGPDGRLELVVGTPGGSTIITTVFQVVSNILDHGMELADAVAAPRVHHQHLPDEIRYEPGGLPQATVEGLRARGHRVLEWEELRGDVQAVRVCRDGTLEGVADPRLGGSAAGV
jgi:gamma-glutamyltranspeptidase/glutathione hydrolase